jgi:hypothetical protein
LSREERVNDGLLPWSATNTLRPRRRSSSESKALLNRDPVVRRAKRPSFMRAIGPADRRDRDALGRALIDDKSEPASEAALLAVEIEREERRLEALAVAVQAAHGQIANVVDANRGDWRRQANAVTGEPRPSRPVCVGLVAPAGRPFENRALRRELARFDSQRQRLSSDPTQ